MWLSHLSCMHGVLGFVVCKRFSCILLKTTHPRIQYWPLGNKWSEEGASRLLACWHGHLGNTRWGRREEESEEQKRTRECNMNQRELARNYEHPLIPCMLNFDVKIYGAMHGGWADKRTKKCTTLGERGVIITTSVATVLSAAVISRNTFAPSVISWPIHAVIHAKNIKTQEQPCWKRTEVHLILHPTLTVVQ